MKNAIEVLSSARRLIGAPFDQYLIYIRAGLCPLGISPVGSNRAAVAALSEVT
jgi:hypothetical protein